MTLAIIPKTPWRQKRSKFGNVKTTIQGITFDSKKEALRWIVLQQMQRDGEICELERQVPYQLNVNGETICKYVADFTYTKRSPKTRPVEFVVEDAKGVRTPEFSLKAKLFKAVFGFAITET